MIELLVGGRWWVVERKREREKERGEDEKREAEEVWWWVERERSTPRGGGIEVSAFFACAMVCALRPCTRWVERTVGVGVLSAPAGFQTSNPRLGFQRGTRNAQDPPKSTGMVCTWAADTPLRASSTSSSVYSFLILLFFARCQGAPRGAKLIFVSAVSRTCLDEQLLVLTFSSPGHRACTPRDVTTARVDILWNRCVFDPVDDRNVENFSRSIVSTLLDYTEWSIASCRRVDKCYRIFFQIFFQASNGLGLIKQRKIF